MLKLPEACWVIHGFKYATFFQDKITLIRAILLVEISGTFLIYQPVLCLVSGAGSCPLVNPRDSFGAQTRGLAPR